MHPLFIFLSIPVKENLDMQLRNFLNKTLLIRRQRSLNFCIHKLVNLLRRTTDKGARFEQGIEFSNDRLEKWCATDALDEVVGFALFFHVV